MRALAQQKGYAYTEKHSTHTSSTCDPNLQPGITAVCFLIALFLILKTFVIYEDEPHKIIS